MKINFVKKLDNQNGLPLLKDLNPGDVFSFENNKGDIYLLSDEDYIIRLYDGYTIEASDCAECAVILRDVVLNVKEI